MDYASLPPDELVRICAHMGQAPAWEEFIRRFNPLIARVVVRTARRWSNCSRSVLDDLVQDTYLKLCSDNCRLLRTFESRQPEAIYSYLKAVTANVVHDHFKATRAAKRWAGETAKDIDTVGSNSTDATRSTPQNQTLVERAILMREIDGHLLKFVAEENLRRSRLIFWLYYRSGLSADAIASIPGIGLTTKGVESTISRLSRLVRAALAEPMRGSGRKQQNPAKEQRGITQADSF
jgi:RNA polymerase sigma-70 factor (ECF subfamily)